MKCKLENCNNEAQKDLIFEVQLEDESWNEITLCKSCYEQLTGECADCITNPSFDDVPGEGKCCNCLASDAEKLEE